MHLSENNFAICFLLEIPLRGFPFQVKFYEQCRVPKHIIVQRISFEKEVPSWGSQAGDISQTFIWGFLSIISPTKLSLKQTLFCFKYLARGVRFKGFYDIQLLFELLVGETIVKSPYSICLSVYEEHRHYNSTSHSII